MGKTPLKINREARTERFRLEMHPVANLVSYALVSLYVFVFGFIIAVDYLR